MKGECHTCKRNHDCSLPFKYPSKGHIGTCHVHRRGFSLAELAIAHPQSLHDTLSKLPFKTFALSEVLKP